MKKSIKQKLAGGELVRVMFFGSLASPKLVEIAGLVGDLDGVWFDQEHSAIPHAQLELLTMACRAAGLPSFVRLAPTDYASVMRPMETGAEGVMIAQIRTPKEVRQVVEWAKYPPQGVRGLFMSNYESAYGTANAAQHVANANRDRWLCIQIETPESVECVEQIVAVEGVDSLFVGPGDLACTLGVTGQPLHPKCIEAMERVAGACKAAGKAWGVLARSREHAQKCREMGCQLFSIVGDIDLVHRGFEMTQRMYDGVFC